MKYMMVLNDGETFTDLDGCCIVEVPDDWDEDTLTDGDKVRQQLNNRSLFGYEDVLYDGCRTVVWFGKTPRDVYNVQD